MGSRVAPGAEVGMTVLVCAALMSLPSGTDALASRFGVERLVDPPRTGFMFIIPCFVLVALDDGDVMLIDAETDSANRERFISDRGGAKRFGTFGELVLLGRGAGGGGDGPFGGAGLSRVRDGVGGPLRIAVVSELLCCLGVATPSAGVGKMGSGQGGVAPKMGNGHAGRGHGEGGVKRR